MATVKRKSEEVEDTTPGYSEYVKIWRPKVTAWLNDELMDVIFCKIPEILTIIYDYYDQMTDNQLSSHVVNPRCTQLAKDIEANKTEIKELEAKIKPKVKLRDSLRDVWHAIDDTYMKHERDTLRTLSAVIDELDVLYGRVRVLTARNTQMSLGINNLQRLVALRHFLGLSSRECSFFSQCLGDVEHWEYKVDFVTRIFRWNDSLKLIERTDSSGNIVPVFEVNASFGDLGQVSTGFVQYEPPNQTYQPWFRRRMTEAVCTMVPAAENRLNRLAHNCSPIDWCIQRALNDDLENWSRDRLYSRFIHLPPIQMLLLLVLNAAGYYYSLLGGSIFQSHIATAAQYWAKIDKELGGLPYESNKKRRVNPASSSSSAAASAAAINVDSD